jgi:hypothetical protein
MTNAHKILVGNSEGYRSLGRPRCKWEENSQIDLREMTLGVWIGVIWLRIGIRDAAGNILLNNTWKDVGKS